LGYREREGEGEGERETNRGVCIWARVEGRFFFWWGRALRENEKEREKREQLATRVNSGGKKKLEFTLSLSFRRHRPLRHLKLSWHL